MPDKISFQLGGTKSKKRSAQNAFGNVEEPRSNGKVEQERPRAPRVIPLQADTFQKPLSAEDQAAVDALTKSSVKKEEERKETVIVASSNATVQEDLPEEADLQAYEQTPVEDFGAALLRGMGWNGTAEEKEDESMPRPHRLGLGATPKLVLPESNGKPLRPDQWKKRQSLEEQQAHYAKERTKQMAQDRQRTLQDGSLVLLRSGDRARLIQLVGVPGLNMVSVQLEGSSDTIHMKRGEIDRLLTRDELLERPYREPKVEESKPASEESQPSSSRGDSKSRRDEPRPEKSSSTSDKKQSLRERERWVVPHIRVRVVSEKLGRKYFRDKGVVVDVTPKGSTLTMSNGRILDRVPERYLETALPKVGGKVIVLTGNHRGAKGQLLERDSSKNRGVLQVYEDQSVLTLSLDDMAEWCGPLDDDDMER